eukprot:COSAG02_NODE_416_length_22749_cov_21.264059_15_plen_32_part_00
MNRTFSTHGINDGGLGFRESAGDRELDFSAF